MKLKTRLLASLLCVATVAGIVAGTIMSSENEVYAATSYAGIESLRSKDTITILEITPDKYHSAIGWYVEGGEPFDMASQVISYIEKTPEERADAINANFDLLRLTSLNSYASVVDQLGYILSIPATYQESLPNLYHDFSLPSVVFNDYVPIEVTGELVYGGEGITNVYRQDVDGSYYYTGDSDPRANMYLNDTAYFGQTTIYTKQLWLAGNISNNHWFAKYVLDWTTEEQPNIVVNTVLPSDVTLTDLYGADLVVITSGFDWDGRQKTPFSATNNISDTIATEIVKLAVGKSGVDTLGNTTLEGALPVLLDMTAYTQNSGSTGIDTIFSGLVGSETKSGVYGSVFLYNPVNEQSNGMEVQPFGAAYNVGFDEPTTGSLLTRSFYQTFTAQEYQSTSAPFYPVYEAIQAENNWRTAEGLDNISSEVSVATAIRHIMLYKTQEIVQEKDGVKILVLQPGNPDSSVAVVNDGIYNDLPTSATVNNGELPWDTMKEWFGITSNNIEVVKMSTLAFSGHNVDLEATYDLIYIGSDISGLNATSGTENDVFGTGSTTEMQYRVYNDSSLDGLIYTSTGDTGLSGNDISDRDYDSLLTYAKNGGAILIAPQLSAPYNQSLGTKTASSKTIQSGSNLSLLLSQTSSISTVLRQDSFTTASTKTAAQETIQTAIHRSKPQLNVTSTPTVYQESNPTDNSHALSFNFTIENHVEDENKRYEISLYVDMVPDGQFTADEKVTGVTVRATSGGASTTVTSLEAGMNYTATVTLHENFSQSVYWKLAVSEVGKSYEGDYVENITFIEPNEFYGLNVLQINGSTGLSLQTDTQYQGLLGNGASANSFVANYYAVNVHTISDTEFNNLSISSGNLSGSSITSLTDVYAFVTEHGLENQLSNSTSSASFRQLIMECYDVILVGFGVTNFDSTSLSAFDNYVSDPENYLVFTRDSFTSGNSLLGTLTEASDVVSAMGSSTYKPIANKLISGETGVATTINQVDKSTITSYPYDLNGASFSVTSASNPHRQADVDNDQLQVWYTLSSNSNYYSNMPNDARNSYFAYTAGNVSYVGITGTSGSSNEAKLLVNTLLTACDIVTIPPEVAITDSTGTGTVGNILVEWDSATSGPKLPTSTEPLYLYFKVTGDSSVASDVSIRMWYQIATGSNSVAGAPTSYEGDNTLTQYLLSTVYRASDHAVFSLNDKLKRDELYYIKVDSGVITEFQAIKEQGSARQEFVVEAYLGSTTFCTSVDFITISLLPQG